MTSDDSGTDSSAATGNGAGRPKDAAAFATEHAPSGAAKAGPQSTDADAGDEPSDAPQAFVRNPPARSTRVFAALAAIALASIAVVAVLAAALSMRKAVHHDKFPTGATTIAIDGQAVTQLGTGPEAIIMLHGASTHRDAWYQFMPRLAKAHFATYAVDYPSASEPRAIVAAVIAYARAHGSTTFVLMGSSRGAGYALGLADLEPRAVVSISAVAATTSSRRVLTIASEQDTAAPPQLAKAIAAGSGAGSVEVTVSGQTHGADMVHPHPEIVDTIIKFLRA